MDNPSPTRRNSVIVGASSALGRALAGALVCAQDAGTVFALSRNGQAPADTSPLEAARATRDGTALPSGDRTTSAGVLQHIAANPTDPESLAAAARTVAERADRVHRLIICTGILHGGDAEPDFRPEKSLGQLRLEHLQRSVAVNAWAPLAAIHAFAGLLRHAEGAVAAALSAMVGSIGDNRLGGWYSYRMSKAALNMGIRNAAIELGRHRHGPIVVAIHPGTTLSPLSAPFAARDRARPADASAAAIVRVLDGLERTDNGRFFNWDGRELPW
jgi:NAD(P)-dependent dehydrogenase (short-subunit alcohol dehydrogenase family)